MEPLKRERNDPYHTRYSWNNWTEQHSRLLYGHCADGGDGGAVYIEGGPAAGLSPNDPGGDVSVNGGAAPVGTGGSIKISSGVGRLASSGRVFISTSDAGSSGVSGRINMMTGTSSEGSTGAIMLQSGTSLYGSGGVIRLEVPVSAWLPTCPSDLIAESPLSR